MRRRFRRRCDCDCHPRRIPLSWHHCPPHCRRCCIPSRRRHGRHRRRRRSLRHRHHRRLFSLSRRRHRCRCVVDVLVAHRAVTIIILCEGCKKVTWMNGLFNTYIPVCTMITPYVPLILRENLETVSNPRHTKKCKEQICVGSMGACRPNVPTFGCWADMSPTCRRLSQPSPHLRM